MLLYGVSTYRYLYRSKSNIAPITTHFTYKDRVMEDIVDKNQIGCIFSIYSLKFYFNCFNIRHQKYWICILLEHLLSTVRWLCHMLHRIVSIRTSSTTYLLHIFGFFEKQLSFIWLNMVHGTPTFVKLKGDDEPKIFKATFVYFMYSFVYFVYFENCSITI